MVLVSYKSLASLEDFSSEMGIVFDLNRKGIFRFIYLQSLL
jgi:hypothetical protein